MSEWWTYRLEDLLMFAPRTYYRLFELYNRDVWPLHVATLIAALLMLRYRDRPRVAAWTLAASWVWIAWAFHLQRYATIFPAAKYLALLFVIQTLLLIVLGAKSPGFRPIFIILALLVHPLLALVFDRPIEWFGIAPDPTVLATLGARRRPLLVIPLLWCAISGATLWVMDAPDALLLPIAGIVALVFASADAIASRRTKGTR